MRLLFLCTGNSARSQMAEAILNHKGRGRFRAESAGSQPAARVNPLAIETLKEHGIRDAFLLLSRRIELLLALPIDKLERAALEARVRAIPTT